MRIDKDEYLICIDDNREFLAKALEDTKGDVEVVVEKDSHIERNTLTVKAKDVVLNLGAKPRPGKIYNLDVTNLLYTSKRHDDLGLVHFFYKPQKDIVKSLWSAATSVASNLKRKELDFLLEDPIWEIMPYHKEKYAGMYTKSKKENVRSRIQIRPEIMPASEYPYVMYHELGHHLHMTFVDSKKLNAQWLKLYSTSIKVQTIKKEQSQRLLDLLLGQEDLPSDFKGQLEEDDALSYKWIVKTIQHLNGLSIKDLDTLFEADMKDEIRSVWPLRSISHKELQPVVSEYSTKNVKELIAECFAFYMTKRKLPDIAVKLIEKSISYAKANREK